MTFEIQKSTQFSINELVIVTKNGNIDISNIFEELKGEKVNSVMFVLGKTKNNEVSTFIDISDRKQSETLLAINEERFRSLYNRTPKMNQF